MGPRARPVPEVLHGRVDNDAGASVRDRLEHRREIEDLMVVVRRTHGNDQSAAVVQRPRNADDAADGVCVPRVPSRTRAAVAPTAGNTSSAGEAP